MLEWISDIICHTWVVRRTCQGSANVVAHPWVKGGASLPVQGGPGCAHWGTWGPGRVPTDKDSRAYAGFLCTSSAFAPESVSTPRDLTISIIAHKGMRRYTPPPRSRG